MISDDIYDPFSSYKGNDIHETAIIYPNVIMGKNNFNYLFKTVDYNILNLNYKIDEDTVLILMPTYNRSDFLIESIKSLVNQDYPNVLIHIIDDNSDVDVVGLISDYIIENNIQNVILSKKYINTGAYISLNYILNYHINDNFGYWTLHGSDDISDTKRVSTLVNFLKSHPDYNSCRSKYLVDVELLVPKYGDSMLLNKKQVFYDIGYYDNNRFGGDSDYSMRVELKYGKIGQVPQTLYYANTGENRLTKKYDKNVRQEYVKKISQEHRQTLYREFIDVNRDSIVCGLSTIESRTNGLKETVNSIINQVDKLIIYQNGYYKVFDYLNNPKIEVISSLLTNIDMGDAGKFYKVSEYKNCYYFSIDDDLIYPSDYVSNSIKKLNEYNNEIIVTYHGRTLKPNAISYYNETLKYFHCLRNQKNDEYIQFGGTGVMCFHTNKVNISFSYFRHSNMADIWMGKFALENNIQILSLKHDIGWITETKFKDNYTIYNTYSKKEKNIIEIILEYNKLLSEKIFDPKKISIIIPTYNIPEYLQECLDSIIKSIKNLECEILVGIDGCQKTLNYVNQNSFDNRIRFFYLEKNVGPYIIKNTLTKLSISDYILYFDSDDIIKEELIHDIINLKDKYELIKPMYLDFQNSVNNIDKNIKTSNAYGEGVFAIKKEIFLNFNGFEGWRCAADSDFMGRLYKNNIKLKHTTSIGFYRRIHTESLTQKPETNMYSLMRRNYATLSKEKKHHGPLDKLITEPYTELLFKTFNTKNTEPLSKPENDIVKEINLPIQNINYNEVINLTQPKKSIPLPSQNIPVNRNELFEIKKGTLAELNRDLFPKRRRRF